MSKTVNELLFEGETGLDFCWYRPWVEIAWDQWTRTRIWCTHGCFEGISDFMDLSQGITRAMDGFRASILRGIHSGCWQEFPAPRAWQEHDEFWSRNNASCELAKGHDEEHRVFDNDEEEVAYWNQRRVYYVNGADVTNKRDFPKPIGRYS